MYEGTIDQLGEDRQTDLNQIEVLKKENNRLERGFPECYQEVKKEREVTKSAMSQVTGQLKLSTEQLNQSQQLMTALNTKFEKHEQNYQSLLSQCMQTFENRTAPPPPRNTFNLPPPQTPWSANTQPPVKAPGPQNCNMNSCYQESSNFRPPLSTSVGVK